jgi:hypothetical protein
MQSIYSNYRLISGYSQIRVCIFSRNNLCTDVNDAGEVSSLTKKIERYNNNQYAQYSIVYIYIYMFINKIYLNTLD